MVAWLIHLAFALLCLFKIGIAVLSNDELSRELSDYNLLTHFDRLSADFGNGVALFRVGDLLFSGNNTVKNKTLAVKYFHHLSEQGYVEAQLKLGYLYEIGDGVAVDKFESFTQYRFAADQGNGQAQLKVAMFLFYGEQYELAHKYYQLAAQQNISEAAFSLAIRYQYGFHAVQSLSDAYYYYKIAADQGHAEALYRLAELYNSGGGTAINHTEACKYFQLYVFTSDTSAPFSSDYLPEANFKLANCYLKGVFVPEDVNLAAGFFKTAADNHHGAAAYELALLHQNNKLKVNNISEAAIYHSLSMSFFHGFKGGHGSRNSTVSLNFLLDAADKGNAIAQNIVGIYYERGTGVTRNIITAIAYYHAAAEGGSIVAHFNLGRVFGIESKSNQNMFIAYKHHRYAAERGHALAQYYLADHLRYGDGAEQNITEAFEWYQKAVEQNVSAAGCCLGEYYEHGYISDKNVDTAIMYYQLCAEKHNKDYHVDVGRLHYMNGNSASALLSFQEASNRGVGAGHFNLARCYEMGIEVSVNLTKAFELYRKAVDRGYSDAQCKLIQLYVQLDLLELNQSEAIDYIRLAVDKNCTEAEYSMGYSLEHGIGLEKNTSEAVLFYQKAGDSGSPDALYRLGLLYINGYNSFKDISDGIKLIRMSAAKNYKHASDWLSFFAIPQVDQQDNRVTVRESAVQYRLTFDSFENNEFLLYFLTALAVVMSSFIWVVRTLLRIVSELQRRLVELESYSRVARLVVAHLRAVIASYQPVIPTWISNALVRRTEPIEQPADPGLDFGGYTTDELDSGPVSDLYDARESLNAMSVAPADNELSFDCYEEDDNR